MTTDTDTSTCMVAAPACLAHRAPVLRPPDLPFLPLLEGVDFPLSEFSSNTRKSVGTSSLRVSTLAGGLGSGPLARLAGVGGLEGTGSGGPVSPSSSARLCSSKDASSSFWDRSLGSTGASGAAAGLAICVTREMLSLLSDGVTSAGGSTGASSQGLWGPGPASGVVEVLVSSGIFVSFRDGAMSSSSSTERKVAREGTLTSAKGYPYTKLLVEAEHTV